MVGAPVGRGRLADDPSGEMRLIARSLSQSLVWIVGDSAIVAFQFLQTLLARVRMSPTERVERMVSSSSVVFNTASHAVIGILLVVRLVIVVFLTVVTCESVKPP